MQRLPIQDYRQFFGPPFLHINQGVLPENSGSLSSSLIQPDPVAYSPYLPPYEFGKSILRLSFKPTRDGQHTIPEIISAINVETINTGSDMAFEETAWQYRGSRNYGERIAKNLHRWQYAREPPAIAF